MKLNGPRLIGSRFEATSRVYSLGLKRFLLMVNAKIRLESTILDGQSGEDAGNSNSTT